MKLASSLRSSRRGPLIVGLGLAGLLGAAGVTALSRGRAVRVAEVADGVVVEEIRAPGAVSSRTQVDLAARIAGVVERVLVEEGDRVEQGQLLAALDDRELVARAAAARAAVASARQGVVAAEAALERALAEAALAREALARDELLFRAGDLTPASIDARRAASLAAEAGVKGAAATLAARREDTSRAAAEAKLAETLASYARVSSPIAGLVTQRRAEVGSAVSPGGALFRIVDPAAVWVDARVDVSQMSRVRPGVPARVRLASGDELAGSVARIAHEADPVTRDQEVRISLETLPDHVTIDEEAQVTLLVGEARGLVVPTAALVHRADADAVFVVRDGRAEELRIRLGAAGPDEAQVIEGLRAGEEVVLDPRDLRPGQRVRPVQSGE